MSRLSKKSPAVCTDLPLEDADVDQKLELMRQLLRSCYGPNGRLKQIHNNIGGRVVTTSTSAVLLSNISASQPIINLIKTSILNHIRRFSDCGLFAANLSLTLIQRVRQCNLRKNVAIRTNKHLLGLCVGYLRGENCACKVKLDFCSSVSLITLARSVICSKPTCVLTEAETLHISKLSLQAFLLSVPCRSPGQVSLGKIETLSMDGLAVLDSNVFPGLLVDLFDDMHPVILDKTHCTPIRMVLFSSSLAGDLSELGDGTIEVHSGSQPEQEVLDQLLELGRQLVEDDVKLFVCQKVIHPVLQQYLRSRDVLVVERLGIAPMESLAQLTGAQPVATLHSAIPATVYGEVKELSIKCFGSKKMLHVCSGEDTGICTIVLCHRNESMLNELKVVYQKTEQVLRLTLKEPSALLGGGCTETHLASYIRYKAMTEAPGVALALRCSPAEYLLGAEAFCRSLESVAEALEHDGGNSLIDLTKGHHWTLPSDVLVEEVNENFDCCGCGMVQASLSQRWSYLNTAHPEFLPEPLTVDGAVQPRVLDSFLAKVSALEVAVETANLALDVQYMIQDVN